MIAINIYRWTIWENCIYAQLQGILKQNKMKINFAILVLKKEDENKPWPHPVLHACCYEYKPTKTDFDSLYHELATDPAFGLVGVKVVLREATPEIVQDIAKKVEKQHENN